MKENPYQSPGSTELAGTRRRAAKAAIKLLIVGSIFITAVVLMYRQRCLHAGSLWESDFMIFYFPPVVALLANGWIIGTALPSKWGWLLRGAATCGLGMLVTFMEVWGQMVIAFNMYGT